jgi:hypothetical protein
VVALGVLTAASSLLLRFGPSREARTEDDAAPTEDTAATGLPRLQASTRALASRAQRAADPLGVIDARQAWRDQAERALLPFATERLGRAPSEAESERLLDALESMNHALRGIADERDPDDEDELDRIARRREYDAAILAADRTYREMLGVGLSGFLRALDPEQVEDLAPPAG